MVLNHINNFSPALEVGEFLIVHRTSWSDVNDHGERHTKEGYLQPVHDKSADARLGEALDDGWVEAGVVWGNSEKLIVLVRPEPSPPEPSPPMIKSGTLTADGGIIEHKIDFGTFHDAKKGGSGAHINGLAAHG